MNDAAVVDACVQVVSTGRVDLGLGGRKSEYPGGRANQKGGDHDAERDIFEGN